MNPELEAMEAELHTEVARELLALSGAMVGLIEGTEAEVRLQVQDDGTWALHTGDPSYDLDHRGHWGAGTLSLPSGERECQVLARYLVDQVFDAIAESDQS